MITMGGNAELELVDSMDPFSEGIVFSVMVLEINQAAKKKLEKYCQFIRRGEDT
jgi:chromosome segregation ATPase